MLTEWGAALPNASLPFSANTDQVRTVTALADEHLTSWTFWDINDGVYNKYTRKWDMDALLSGFVRTYAQAIAGTPTSMSFDIATASFSLEFAADVTIGAPTEVVVPSILYPQGYVVQTSPNFTWDISPSQPGVLLFTSGASSLSSIKISRAF